MQRVKARNRGVFKFSSCIVAGQRGAAPGSAQYLKKAWKKVGIDVEVVAHDNQRKIILRSPATTRRRSPSCSSRRHPAQITTFIDPNQTREGQRSLVYSRLNDPGLTPRIEALLRGSPEVGVWQAATADLIERVNTMVPYIWLDHAPRNFFARTNVVNITQSTLPGGRVAADFHMGSHPLSQIWLKRS